MSRASREPWARFWMGEARMVVIKVRQRAHEKREGHILSLTVDCSAVLTEDKGNARAPVIK